jgi:hypothetical protein
VQGTWFLLGAGLLGTTVRHVACAARVFDTTVRHVAYTARVVDVTGRHVAYTAISSGQRGVYCEPTDGACEVEKVCSAVSSAKTGVCPSRF